MKRNLFARPVLAASALLLTLPLMAQASLPAISLDEFFNTSEVQSAKLSPDGTAAVIATSTPDWQHNRFRQDLWLWRAPATRPILLTQARQDSAPQWSPDGKFIAFISNRAVPGEAEPDTDKDGTPRIWLINPLAGEAFPLYREKTEAHTFAWMPESNAILFAVTQAVSKEQQDTDTRQWNDVIRWREQEHGDVLLRLPIKSAVEANLATPTATHTDPEPAATAVIYPRGSAVVTSSPYAIEEIVPSPQTAQIAFLTRSISHRMEQPDASEIYLVELDHPTARQLTHNQAIEQHLVWSPDGKTLYFMVPAAGGSLEGPYTDVQGRLYRCNPTTAAVERIGVDFPGTWNSFEILPDGGLIGLGMVGTETQIYRVTPATAQRLAGLPGSYADLSVARSSGQILITHSTVSDPAELYLAHDLNHLSAATQITDFNAIFRQRAHPQARPYLWKADDGTSIEGMLIYPPGKFNQTHLRMLTLIHGGPADADGDRFGADWYDWAGLAAANGWLVFRPNYRGSSGYGDQFMQQIQPHLVSRPGKDILEGVDALVKDGIADPDHLAIGGYSYGGYMTNWLLTQTSRFKAAVTGAGAVEHTANWGNDDVTFDDAWYLSGTPWEQPQLYQSEAAIFQFDKVKTPTHLVAGNADVRVSYFEGVLMERALQTLNIPHSFLVFPGEGHPLANNPWHGYIKVREELKWLDKYAGN